MNDTPTPLETHRILVIDDMASIHEDFRKILTPTTVRNPAVGDIASAIFGAAEARQPRPVFSVDSATQGEAGLALVLEAKAQDRPYALAFVDMRMPPGWDGIETIRHIWAADPHIQIVICTAYSDTSWDEAFRVLGQSDSLLVLKKPFDRIEALQLANALTKKWTIARQNRDRLAQLDGMIRQRTTELHIAQERFSRAFSASPLPQAIQDLATGRFVEINAAFEKLCGQTRIQFLDDSGKAPVAEAPFAELRQSANLLDRLRAGQAIDDHAFTLQLDGSTPREMRGSSRAVSIADRPSAVWVFRDITEHIQLEQQFRQGQKMEAVGQLAAGIAHDFNNLLTVILSYSSFVLDDTTLAAEHRSGLGQVCAAAQRAAALTRQLLVFSRRQIAMPEPIDIGYTLENLRDMLSRLLPERIKLEWFCGEQVPRVLADAANLEQIVMNLIVNARDAIANCGTIRLDVKTVTLSDEDLRKHATARPGEFVRLSVSDDGKGMEPAVVARIFEPFFTTKEVGEGTGLGLSTVYALVQQHSGWIQVQSVPNRGTTFEIFLPALKADAEAEIDLHSPQIAPAVPDGGGETVLLVEDEPFLRETAALVATRAGYRVTQAADGPAALHAWSEASRPFDLLLTDLMMPNGLTGIQLAAQLRAQHPSLRVIFSTGYNDELLRSGASAIEGTLLLLKPYTSSELLEMLHQALRLAGRRGTARPFGSRPPIPLART